MIVDQFGREVQRPGSMDFFRRGMELMLRNDLMMMRNLVSDLPITLYDGDGRPVDIPTSQKIGETITVKMPARFKEPSQ